MNDVDLINEAYTEMYNESMKKKLGTIALIILGAIGAKEAADGVQRSMDEYTHGLPSLQEPTDIDDMVPGEYMAEYLNKVGLLKVALAPKHIEALKFVAQSSPSEYIRIRAQDILEHQHRISQQR